MSEKRARSALDKPGFPDPVYRLLRQTSLSDLPTPPTASSRGSLRRHGQSSVGSSMLGGIALIAASASPSHRPLLIWNATSSVPVGLYRIVSADPLTVGTLVVVRTPPKMAPLFAERVYLPLGVPLVKPVAAMTGNKVCRHGRMVTIDGRVAAIAWDRDHVVRKLPRWQGCRRLTAGEVFLLATSRPDSLDSRYFGPVPVSSVIGRAAEARDHAAQTTTTPPSSRRSDATPVVR